MSSPGVFLECSFCVIACLSLQKYTIEMIVFNTVTCVTEGGGGVNGS